MKPGDRLWIAVRVNDDAEDAIDELVIHDPDDFNVTHWARIEEDNPIPDSPMLPAVARWLAEHQKAADALYEIAWFWLQSVPNDVEVSALKAALTEGQG